ncbi:MAG: hypothetical protein MJ123_06380 [Lachnospiraceae bacterium]|nr:hypothetical protein [Lachnospiraceae bacterium]
MTKKEIPVLLTLTAAAITALSTYFNGYSLKEMTIALLATIVAFYFIGSVIKTILDSFDKKNSETEEVSESGEVIEKEAVPEQNEENGN